MDSYFLSETSKYLFLLFDSALLPRGHAHANATRTARAARAAAAAAATAASAASQGREPPPAGDGADGCAVPNAAPVGAGEHGGGVGAAVPAVDGTCGVGPGALGEPACVRGGECTSRSSNTTATAASASLGVAAAGVDLADDGEADDALTLAALVRSNRSAVAALPFDPLHVRALPCPAATAACVGRHGGVRQACLCGGGGGGWGAVRTGCLCAGVQSRVRAGWRGGGVTALSPPPHSLSAPTNASHPLLARAEPPPLPPTHTGGTHGKNPRVCARCTVGCPRALRAQALFSTEGHLFLLKPSLFESPGWTKRPRPPSLRARRAPTARPPPPKSDTALALRPLTDADTVCLPLEDHEHKVRRGGWGGVGKGWGGVGDGGACLGWGGWGPPPQLDACGRRPLSCTDTPPRRCECTS
jgi:hypothetical protein